MAKMLIVLLAVAAVAFGQAVTGTIFGLVTDATGAVVSGAMVQIQNVDTGLSRSEQTDKEGRYLSQNLPLGTYAVTVQQTGFRTEERKGITLSVASEVAVNIQLTVGNTQEKVEVITEAGQVETANATVSQLTTGEQVRDLPLNGRSMDELAGLTPGLFVDRSNSPVPSIGFGARMSINGSRVDAILYLLDGTYINDPSGGAPISAALNMLGVEGILEFRVLTHNFSAEYGRVSGAVMSMVTRAGTNQFHGSAYEFLRNNVFDARNFFNPGGLPPFRRNQFGGSVGGPIIKDRFFFFANYEGLRQLQGTTVNIPVPDLNARNGLLPNAVTGQLQQTTVNPAAVPFVSLFPLPNGPEISGGTAQYLTTFLGTANENYTMARMDYRISDKDNFYARYVYNPSNRELPRPVPTWGELDQSNPHFVVMSETHVFSSNSLNEVRVAFNRVDAAATAVTFVPIDPSITVIPGEGLARIEFSAIPNGLGGQLPELGTNSGRPESYPQNTFQETETFSTVRGAHSLKFGVDVERVDINANESSGMVRGTETFGGLSALLAGTPSNISLILPNPTNHFTRGDRRDIIGWFVQDDFRLRPNVTLNLGLRQDIFTTPNEVNGYSGDLINLTDPAETPGPPFVSDKKTFSPRVGLAWDPFGDGKTSVRVGAGVYYQPIDGRAYYEASFGGNLWLNTIKITNPPFPDALANGTTNVLPSVTALQYHLQNPVTYNYNFEVQRQLTRDLTLRVAYIGSTSDHLLRLVNWDTRVPSIIGGVLTYPASGSLINPNFSSIQYESTDGRANYNGLQTNLTKRLSAGLQVTAAFTYSKAMSNSDQAIAGTSGNTPATTMNPLNLAEDYGLSVYDERFHAVLNGSYELPFAKSLNGALAKKILGGWAINGIYVYGSGHPLTVLDGFNNSRTGDSNSPDRPSLNPGFSPNPISGVTAGCAGIPAGQTLGTAGLWFDPCAFSLPPAGTFGNLGRDTVTGPGTNNLDSALVKNTAISERIRLQFRWELFNLLNHAQFSAPNEAAFTSARTANGSAGQITTTITPNREMQLGLKVIF